MNRIILSLAVAFTITFAGAATAAITEIGDLNFIVDAGNPSDGLGFLDMTFSDGLTLGAAIANAQFTYADVRVATADEFDDLFLAAGVTYSGSLAASDAFAAGGTVALTAAGDIGVATLVSTLGTTASASTLIFTDPDGDGSATSTRDVIDLNGLVSRAILRNVQTSPPSGSIGWLLVSDSAVVPEPSTGLLVALGVLGLGISRRRVAVRMNTRQ